MQQNLPQKPFLSSPILADDLESDPISSGFAASLAHPGRNAYFPISRISA
jgi:hypothetical protein